MALLTALSFALWPLGRAAQIPGAALFRDAMLPERVRPAARRHRRKCRTCGGAGRADRLSPSADRRFAVWFCAAALVTLGLFRLGGLALDARRTRPPGFGGPSTRLGFANLHRPGTPTPLMLVSVGLGLSTLAAVAMIQGNVRREITGELPANAPSFYFVDIQTVQLDRFDALVRAHARRRGDRSRCPACAPASSR